MNLESCSVSLGLAPGLAAHCQPPACTAHPLLSCQGLLLEQALARWADRAGHASLPSPLCTSGTSLLSKRRAHLTYAEHVWGHRCQGLESPTCSAALPPNTPLWPPLLRSAVIGLSLQPHIRLLGEELPGLFSGLSPFTGELPFPPRP